MRGRRWRWRLQGRDDLLVRDHDSRAHSRQSQLREAHAEDGVLVPGECGIAEDDAGKRKPVGVVHDKRHVAHAGDLAEAFDLRIGHDVARGVGGPRHADCADVLDLVEPVEVHSVLEHPVAEVGDGRSTSDEQSWSEAEVAVADVLRRERQKDTAHPSVLPRAREQVEQGEERRLAAVGQRDVALAHVPAVLAPQEIGQRACETSIALRPVVASDGPLERAVVLHERQGARPKDVLRGRYDARIPTAEIHEPAARGCDLPEVVHERARARLAGQPLSQCRQVSSPFPYLAVSSHPYR